MQDTNVKVAIREELHPFILTTVKTTTYSVSPYLRLASSDTQKCKDLVYLQLSGRFVCSERAAILGLLVLISLA